MRIDKVNDENRSLVKAFISKIPAIQAIEDSLLEKMQVLLDKEQIKGIVTYETYIDNGLIRYFIFQKDVPFECLKDMFDKMKKDAKSDKIRTLISVVNQEELADFFLQLDFFEINASDLYLNESAICESVDNPIVLLYEV